MSLVDQLVQVSSHWSLEKDTQSKNKFKELVKNICEPSISYRFYYLYAKPGLRYIQPEQLDCSFHSMEGKRFHPSFESQRMISLMWNETPWNSSHPIKRERERERNRFTIQYNLVSEHFNLDFSWLDLSIAWYCLCCYC